MALGSGQEFRHFINGEFVASSSGKQLEVLNPVNGEPYAQVYEAGLGEVDIAVIAIGPSGTQITEQGHFDMDVANRMGYRMPLFQNSQSIASASLFVRCPSTATPYFRFKFQLVWGSIKRL